MLSIFRVFICLISSFAKCLLKSFAYFWIGLFLFLFLSPLYILSISPLSEMRFVNIFSQRPRTFSVSFAEQKFLISMKSNLSLFSFKDYAFDI